MTHVGYVDGREGLWFRKGAAGVEGGGRGEERSKKGRERKQKIFGRREGNYSPASFPFSPLSRDGYDYKGAHEAREKRAIAELGVEKRGTKARVVRRSNCKEKHCNSLSNSLSPRSPTHLSRRGDGQEGGRGDEREGEGGEARHGCEKGGGK